MSEHAAKYEHHWETSPWPLVLSVGILFMPLAFAFYFVYAKPIMAVASLGIGVPLIILSIAGWINEVVGQKEESGLSIAAMPLFIVAEAFIFVALFVSYWAMRLLSPSWPPAGTPVHMPVAAPIIMTIMLVSSSFTIHFAEARLEKDDRSGFITWLMITIILGVAFLGLSVNEYITLFREGFNFKTNAYSTAFYSITGFHGSHVLVGLGIFISMLIPGLMGRTSKTFVKAGSMYWHFVDIIWFFVVSQVYFW